MKKDYEALKEISNVQKRLEAFRNLSYSDNGTSYARELYEENIVNKSYVCQRIKEEAIQNNLESIAILVAEINDCSVEYFRIDGYGNFETLTSKLLDALIDDVIENIDE